MPGYGGHEWTYRPGIGPTRPVTFEEFMHMQQRPRVPVSMQMDNESIVPQGSRKTNPNYDNDSWGELKQLGRQGQRTLSSLLRSAGEALSPKEASALPMMRPGSGYFGMGAQALRGMEDQKLQQAAAAGNRPGMLNRMAGAATGFMGGMLSMNPAQAVHAGIRGARTGAVLPSTTPKQSQPQPQPAAGAAPGAASMKMAMENIMNNSFGGSSLMSAGMKKKALDILLKNEKRAEEMKKAFAPPQQDPRYGGGRHSTTPTFAPPRQGPTVDPIAGIAGRISNWGKQQGGVAGALTGAAGALLKKPEPMYANAAPKSAGLAFDLYGLVTKQAFQPMMGGAPADPMAGGQPPMDPAMMGMDPSMMGMDPAAMGGMPPGGDPAAGGVPGAMPGMEGMTANGPIPEEAMAQMPPAPGAGGPAGGAPGEMALSPEIQQAITTAVQEAVGSSGGGAGAGAGKGQSDKAMMMEMVSKVMDFAMQQAQQATAQNQAPAVPPEESAANPTPDAAQQT